MPAINFPLKPYLPISDVALRWECEESDVIDYIRFDMLGAAAILRETDDEIRSWVIDGSEFWDPDGDEVDLDRAYSITAKVAAEVLRYKGDAVGFDKLLSRAGDRVMSIPMLPGIPSSPKFYLRSTDIVVMREDIEKFENAHGKNQAIPRDTIDVATGERNALEKPADSALPPAKEIRTRERAGLEKTIGALTRLYVEASTGNRLGSVNSPNFAQVASDIDEHLQKHNIDPTGLRDRSLKGRLSTGIKRLLDE